MQNEIQTDKRNKQILIGQQKSALPCIFSYLLLMMAQDDHRKLKAHHQILTATFQVFVSENDSCLNNHEKF